MSILREIANDIFNSVTVQKKEEKKTVYEMVREREMTSYDRITTYGFFVLNDFGEVVERDSL